MSGTEAAGGLRRVGAQGLPGGLRLHIIRHADPDYAHDTITARGRCEAEALAARAHELAVDRLFVSPLGRARATAEPLEAATGLAATVEEWAREFDVPRVPDGEGGTSMFWNVSGHYVRELAARRPGETVTDGAASASSGLGPDAPWPSWPVLDGYVARIHDEVDRLEQGARGFLHSLGYRYSPEGFHRMPSAAHQLTVAVVCHGALGVTWLAWLLGIPYESAWTSLFLPVSSVSTVVFEERGGSGVCVPRAVRIGDTSHLFAAGLGVNYSGLPGAVAGE